MTGISSRRDFKPYLGNSEREPANPDCGSHPFLSEVVTSEVGEHLSSIQVDFTLEGSRSFESSPLGPVDAALDALDPGERDAIRLAQADMTPSICVGAKPNSRLLQSANIFS
jgi:hypothetical protein